MNCPKCEKPIPEKLNYCPSCRMAQMQGFANYKQKREVEEKSKNSTGKKPNVFMDTFGKKIITVIAWFALGMLINFYNGLWGIYYFIIVTPMIISVWWFFFRTRLIFSFLGGKNGFKK